MIVDGPTQFYGLDDLITTYDALGNPTQQSVRTAIASGAATVESRGSYGAVFLVIAPPSGVQATFLLRLSVYQEAATLAT